jgi:predicted DNA-binding transcriptional regulator YafY
VRFAARDNNAMRRADRLFQLVQLVRGRRLSTAEFLAERLQVSPRTVYRDVADLQAQGVPLEGEAGVGYRMRAGFDLPPLMFTRDEAQALVAAVRVTQPRVDGALALQAEMALSKILAALPSSLRTAAESVALFAMDNGPDVATRERLTLLRQAAENRRYLDVTYLDLQGQRSQRQLRPLACFSWDQVWTLAAWCELRQALRSFRVDRFEHITVLDKGFRDEPGKTLADLFRQHQIENHR